MLSKLNKLLRYEFKFYFRIMPPFYLALILLALAAGLQIRFSPNANAGRLIWVVWICVFTVAVAVNFILVIQRFRDNLLRDPAYLMLTLPVGPWSLIASKAISTFCVSVMSILTGAASLFFLTAAGNMAGENKMLFETFRNLLLHGDPVYTVLYTVSMLVLIFQQLCLIYAVMTASQILPRFRAIAAFIAYIAAASLVKQVIAPVLVAALVDGGIPHIIWSVAVDLIFAALFFWLSGFLLKHTLNLE